MVATATQPPASKALGPVPRIEGLIPQSSDMPLRGGCRPNAALEDPSWQGSTGSGSFVPPVTEKFFVAAPMRIALFKTGEWSMASQTSKRGLCCYGKPSINDGKCMTTLARCALMLLAGTWNIQAQAQTQNQDPIQMSYLRG